MDLETVGSTVSSDSDKNKDDPTILNEITGDCFDVTSRKGQFAWTTIDGVNLPYILRNGEKYISARMAGYGLMNKYIQRLSSHVYAYNRVRAYFITDSEAMLLNEINYKHLGGSFGKTRFTKHDLVTKLEDTIQLYNFVSFCFKKATNTHIKTKSNYGIIQVGPHNVPYVVINDNRFVPTLFFDIPESFESKILNVESWDLAYLKILCDIIGIEDSEFPEKLCPIINVKYIQKLFPEKEEKDKCSPFLVVKDTGLLNKRGSAAVIPWFVVSKEGSS